jgi:hypothetical protein
MTGRELPDGMLRAALRYLAAGWCPVPLCWPDAGGRCGCGRGHGAKAGKAALVPGYTACRPTEALVRRWWRAWPAANVGLLLGPSGLLVIDLDGPEALAEARALGLPDGPTVTTAHGGHVYCRAPAAPLARSRAVHQGATRRIDILAGGHVVAPPSRHRSGALYGWRDGAAPRAEALLPPAPAWAAALLGGTAAHPVAPAPSPPREAPSRGYRLPRWVHELLREGWVGRYPSRSEAVWAAVHALLRGGCTPGGALDLLLRREWTWAGKADPERYLAGEVARALAKG